MWSQWVWVSRQRQIDRGAAEFLVERQPQLANAGAGIEDDDVAVGADLDAGRVASVTDRGRAGHRNRSAHAPEFYPRRRRMEFQLARLASGQFSRPGAGGV